MKNISKFRGLTTAIFLFSCQWCMAQIADNTNVKNFRYTGFLSVARSSFAVNGYPSSPSYPSLELRLGAGIAKPIGKYFELKSGLYLGLKVKRESYFYGPSKQYTQEPGLIYSLDKAASDRSHLFVDLPLTLQLNLPKTKIGLKAGLNSRFWVPNNDNVDVLTARQEIGMLGGISYNLIKRINIGLDYYYGLTDISGGSYSINNSQLAEYHVRNQFTQLTIEHKFK
jgi:hypothetical protein